MVQIKVTLHRGNCESVVSICHRLFVEWFARWTGIHRALWEFRWSGNFGVPFVDQRTDYLCIYIHIHLLQIKKNVMPSEHWLNIIIHHLWYLMDVKEYLDISYTPYLRVFSYKRLLWNIFQFQKYIWSFEFADTTVSFPVESWCSCTVWDCFELMAQYKWDESEEEL